MCMCVTPFHFLFIGTYPTLVPSKTIYSWVSGTTAAGIYFVFFF